MSGKISTAITVDDEYVEQIDMMVKNKQYDSRSDFVKKIVLGYLDGELSKNNNEEMEQNEVELNTTKEQLKNSEVELNNTREQLKNNELELDKAKAEVDKLRANLSEKNKQYENQMSQFFESNKESEDYEAQIQAYKGKLEDSQKQNTIINNELSKVKEQVTQLNTINKGLVDENGNLRKQLTDSKQNQNKTDEKSVPAEVFKKSMTVAESYKRKFNDERAYNEVLKRRLAEKYETNGVTDKMSESDKLSVMLAMEYALWRRMNIKKHRATNEDLRKIIDKSLDEVTCSDESKDVIREIVYGAVKEK